MWQSVEVQEYLGKWGRTHPLDPRGLVEAVGETAQEADPVDAALERHLNIALAVSFIGLGAIAPIDLGIVDKLCDAGRDTRPEIAGALTACLQTQHAVLATGAQPVGHHGPSGTGPDDDVIIALRWGWRGGRGGAECAEQLG